MTAVIRAGGEAAPLQGEQALPVAILTTIQTGPVAPVRTREPGTAFRMMVGGVAVLLVGLLIGLGIGTGRLDDLRKADEAAISDRQDALAQREQAAYDREVAVGQREAAVTAREDALKTG